MKRNSYGMTHKHKTDIPIGVHVPIMSQEMVAGDIIRIDPEILLKSVVPPVTAITDQFKYNVEAYFTPDRLLDNKFVANMSTTKTGQVKGQFKSFTLESLANYFNDTVFDTGIAGSLDNDTRLYSKCPENFAYADFFDCVGNPEYNSKVSMMDSEEQEFFDITDKSRFSKISKALSIFPVASEVREVGGVKKTRYGTNWFGQNSLMDYLGIMPSRDIGLGYKGRIRTNHISAYYMIMNFYHTNPEYQKYLAPEYDYDYGNTIPRDVEGYSQCGAFTETLHRYESLEEEFGNGFVPPRMSGRCWRGLCIANWENGYFSNTTVDAQRGIAPQVPVAISGKASLSDPRLKLLKSSDNSPYAYDGTVLGNNSSYNFKAVGGKTGDLTATMYPNNSALGLFTEVDSSDLLGSFVISDLRTAIALQHFQEDAQGTYKWSDFLLRMCGIAPVDNLQDQPMYCGGFTGTMIASEVIQTSATSEGDLGDIGGRMSAYNKGKRITCLAKEPGVFTIILTLKPERNFQSGIDRQFTRLDYTDMFWKQFVGIGAQAIRCDELLTTPYGATGDPIAKNWGFTDRYEEMKHKRNRISGGCRSVNGFVGLSDYYDSEDLERHLTGSATVISLQKKDYEVQGIPNLDKHMFAIGDSYSFDTSSFVTYGIGNGAVYYTENNPNFLLCLPQLTDVFVSDKEIPFMATCIFNMDMFRPVPVYTKPGISYV